MAQNSRPILTVPILIVLKNTIVQLLTNLPINLLPQPDLNDYLAPTLVYFAIYLGLPTLPTHYLYSILLLSFLHFESGTTPSRDK